MKKLLLIVALITMIFAASAYASDIAYVSYVSGCVDCDCYQTLSPADYEYCNELEYLGYTIEHISDSAVGGPLWTGPMSSIDPPKLIFLGNVSSAKAKDSAFCDTVTGEGKMIFSTGINNYFATGFTGCVFREDYYPEAGTNNTCTDGTLRVYGTGSYITGDLPTNQIIDTYLYVTKPELFYVHDYTQLGDITYRCQPAGEAFEADFPVVNINEDAVFWGLNDPSKYKDDAWGVFDRTVTSILSPETQDKINGTLTINGTEFKPGEYVNITFEPTVTIENAPIVKLQLVGSTSTTTPYTMVNEGGNWTKKILLPTTIANGTYSVIVTVSELSGDIRKNIDIIPYKLSISTDKYSYAPGDNVKISVKTIDAYKSNLKMTATISIENPAGAKTELIKNKEITYTYSTNYTLSDTAVGGKYKAIIALIDGDTRIVRKELEFFVKSSANLNATPSQWNTDTKTGKSTQTFVIGNKGNTTISSLSITTTGDCEITLNKKTLTNIAAKKTANFTATSQLTDEGTCEGEIILSSTEIEFYIPVEIEYEAEAIVDSLVISPSSVSIYTIPGKTITQKFTIENIADTDTKITGYSKSESIKDIVSIKTVPSAISSDKSGEMVTEVDTTGLTPKTYSGTISVSSDIGNDSSSVSIIVIGNIYDEADDYLAELSELLPSIEALNKKDGYEGLMTTYNNVKGDLESAKEKYSAGDYETSYTLFEGAKRNLSDLRDNISVVAAEKKNYGGIIWGFAAIVIIGIVGVLIWRYKDKIMDIIDNMLGKSKYREEQPEYYPPEEPQGGDYRTEYY